MKNNMCNILLVAMIAIVQSAVAQDYTSNLVTYYPFNGNANDAMGSNNGTLKGNTVLTTVRFNIANKAYFFDGNGDYITFTAAPSHNDFTIELPSAENRLLIEVFDVMGRSIFKQNTEGGQLLKMTVSHWLSGVYFVEVRSQNDVWTEQFVKY